MKQQTVLITGASSGIGKATALLFAAKGWNVVATMRSPEKEEELTKLPNIMVVRLDVQDAGTIAPAIEAGIRSFGQIDLLVNNAGYGQFGLFEAATTQQVRQQFEVNVFGMMDTIQAILPHFRAQKSGMIINISSGAGRFTLPLISLYAASKFALEGFSEALSFELAALNIGVKIVEPGGTTTNFNKVSEDNFSHDAALTEYGPFMAAAGQLYDKLRSQQLATPDEVAAVIYEAATDGTPTLRYLVGNEDFKKRVAARMTMPDQQYVESVKNSYLPYMPKA